MSIESEVIHQTNVVIDILKKLSHSEIRSLGASDYEEMEKKGKIEYDSARALFNYLKHTKI